MLDSVDEGQLIPAAVRIGAGDPNPHNFIYPSLYKYLLFLSYGFYFAVGKIFGVFSSLDAFRRAYFIDPSAFYVIGRSISALLGSVSVLLTYAIARRVYSSLAGVVSAAFFAVEILNVKYSHHALPDVTMVFFFLLGIWFSLKIIDEGRLRDYLAAGAFGGLSISAKYNGVSVIVAISVAHVLRHYKGSVVEAVRRKARWIASAIAFVLLFFLVGTPFALLDYRTFLSDVGFQNVVISQHQSLGGLSVTIWSYLRELFLPVRWDLFGNYFGLLAFAGSVYGLLGLGKKGSLLAVVVWAHFLFFAYKTSSTFLKPHYMLPIIPLTYVLGGVSLAKVKDAVSHRAGRALQPYWYLLLLFLLLGPATRVLVFDYARGRTDTGLLARSWVEANLPAGSRILYVGTRGLALVPTQESILKESEESRNELPSGKLEAVRSYKGKKYYIRRLYQGWGFISPDRVQALRRLPKGVELLDKSRMSLDFWRTEGIDYVIVTGKSDETEFQSYLRRVPKELSEVLKQVRSECDLVKEFIPDYPSRPGVIVRIYRVEGNARNVAATESEG